MEQRGALTGATLADRYRLEEVIGVGGSGLVYSAEQIGLGRRVAVKVLRPELSHLASLLETEALAASRINHPNAVTIYDVGVTADGLPYLVMELLRGRTLAAVIEHNTLRVSRVLQIGVQILSALEEAHDCGVIHRDLKSENVILVPQRSGDLQVKVIDFGLALVDANQTGGVAGSPEYMAPEQIRGEPLGPAVDLYAAGIVLYEMIVGRTPFAGAQVATVLDAQLRTPITAPHEIVPSCPRALGKLVARALSKDPAGRHESAQQMRSHLEEIRSVHITGTRMCRSCGHACPSGEYCANCGADQSAASPSPASTARTHSTLPRQWTLDEVARRTADLPGRPTRATLQISERGAPLIGRERHLEEMLRFFAGGTNAGTLALVGPHGVGKSRLVREAAARSRGVVTFFAGPDPSGARIPWYPILSMLEAVLGIDEPPDYERIREAMASCGLPERDVPGLAEVFGLEGPLSEAELAVRRREATAAVMRTLREAHHRFPGAVLCFADADEYDLASTNMCDALSCALDGTGIRMIMTLGSADDAPGGAAVIEVEPLTAAQTGELAEELLPGQLLPPAEQIHAMTGGLPFAIEQTVSWIAAGHGPEDGEPSLIDLLADRVHALPPAARRALQAVAVHGLVVDRTLAEAVAGAQLSDEVLGDLSRARLLEINGDLLILPSELLVDVVRASLPASIRTELHSRALRAYDALGVPTCPAVLGAHAESAEIDAEAYEWLLAAGDDAVRRFDDPSAASFYGRALRVARRQLIRDELGAGARVIEASVRAADVLRYTGQLKLAAGILDESEVAQPGPSELAELARARARLAATAGDLLAAAVEYRTALAHGMRSRGREFLCDSYIDFARVLAEAGDQATAIQEIREGIVIITLGEGLGACDVDRLWLLGVRQATLELQQGKLAAAEQTALAAMKQAEHTGSQHGVGRALALLARITESAGELRRALSYRTRAIEAMRRIGDRRSTAELLFANARASEELGPLAARVSEQAWNAMTEGARIHGERLAMEIGMSDLGTAEI